MAVFSCSATAHPQVVYRNSVTMLAGSINCTLYVSHFDRQRIVGMSHWTSHWQTICCYLLFLDLKEACLDTSCSLCLSLTVYHNKSETLMLQLCGGKTFLHSCAHRLRIYKLWSSLWAWVILELYIESCTIQPSLHDFT